MQRLEWMLTAVLLGSFVLVGMARAAEDEPMGVPALALIQAVPNDAVFEKTVLRKPLQLVSRKDAKAYFDAEQFTALDKAVDWASQTVLVFAWHGSGGDRFDAAVKESADGPRVEFRFTGGLTRDLRPHKHVYAVRKGVPWTVSEGAG